MKVFGIGMFKTGTTSLEKALGILGIRHIPGANYGELFSSYTNGVHPEYDPDRFTPEEIEAIKDLTSLFDGFSDHPWMWSYKVCHQLYPDAKFILTLRENSDKIADSDINFWKMHGVSEEDIPDREDFILRYENHNDMVRDYFKDSDNYIELCWENGDGWEELCQFLDLPVPNVKFPHKNRGVYS